ncbi:MAG: DUF2358 domain-containing protein [Phormidesmis sp.]
MDLVEQLKQDYARFPEDQTYSLYAKDVQFKDPLNEFEGVDRYQQMIGFLSRFFSNVQMDLHEIQQVDPTLITMRWTLNMTAPLPWSPRLAIPGHTELGLNESGLISSHVDYWERSRFDVLKQVFDGR